MKIPHGTRAARKVFFSRPVTIPQGAAMGVSFAVLWFSPDIRAFAAAGVLPGYLTYLVCPILAGLAARWLWPKKSPAPFGGGGNARKPLGD